MSTQNKPDSKNWTHLAQTAPQLKKGVELDLKKSNQYEIIVSIKKDFLFSF